MPFASLLNKTRGNVARFFNSTLPNATRTGVRYMNTHIVPFARKAHQVTKAIGNEVTTNETIPAHLRKKAEKVSSFADLGLSRLENVQQGVNRVSKNLGVE